MCAPTDQASGGPARAVIILPPSRERDDLIAALRVTGYDVRLSDRREDPITVANRGAARSRRDRHRGWRRRSLGHRFGVDRATGRSGRAPSCSSRRCAQSTGLRAVVAGVDAVFPIERMVDELPRYARTLARAGAPPSSVLLAEHDAGRAAAVAAWLEECNIRVVRCAMAQAIQELIDREVPDALILAATLPDAAGEAVTRMVRQDPRFHLLPILLLGPGDAADQIAGLRAGADDFLAYPPDPTVLTQTVISPRRARAASA